jgi:hypothetical protein
VTFFRARTVPPLELQSVVLSVLPSAGQSLLVVYPRQRNPSLRPKLAESPAPLASRDRSQNGERRETGPDGVSPCFKNCTTTSLTALQQGVGCDTKQPPWHPVRPLCRQGRGLCCHARRCRAHTQKLPGDDLVSFVERKPPWGHVCSDNGDRKYQFMEVNLQRRMAGLRDKIPDIRKTLETVQFLKLRRVGDVWHHVGECQL